MTPTTSVRRRTAAALAVSAAVLLAACGGSDKSVLDNDQPSTTAAPASSTATTAASTTAGSGSTESSAPSSSTASSAASSTSAPSALDALPDCPVEALAAATSPVEITVWHSLNADLLSGTLAKLTDQYNSSQAKVKVKYVNQGSYEDSIKKYFDTDPKQRPDVVQFPEYTVQNTVDNDAAVPVQKCMEAAKFDDSKFLATAKEAYSTGGVQWAMPFNVSTPVLFYNKKFFREAGLDPEKPPTTLEELRDYSQKLVDSKVATYGIALESGFDSGGGWFLEQWFAKLGAPFVDNDNGRSGRATAAKINNPDIAKALGMLQSLITDKLATYVGDNSTSGFDNLLSMADASQPAAMAIATSASIGSVLDIVKGGQFPSFQIDDVGIAAMPGPGKPGSIVGGAAMWMSNSGDPARVAASWDYINYLVQAQQQSEWGAVTGYVPVRTDANDIEPMKSKLADPRFQVAPTALGELPEGTSSAGPIVGPLREIRLVVAEGMAKIMTGADVNATLADLESRANSLITDYNARSGG